MNTVFENIFQINIKSKNYVHADYRFLTLEDYHIVEIPMSEEVRDGRNIMFVGQKYVLKRQIYDQLYEYFNLFISPESKPFHLETEFVVLQEKWFDFRGCKTKEHRNAKVKNTAHALSLFAEETKNRAALQIKDFNQNLMIFVERANANFISSIIDSFVYGGKIHNDEQVELLVSELIGTTNEYEAAKANLAKLESKVEDSKSKLASHILDSHSWSVQDSTGQQKTLPEGIRDSVLRQMKPILYLITDAPSEE